ncbi:Glutaredoxin-3 [Enhygromyxa salina]|uniref:Glutaredoxin-3 n=1 Tax=Enhygromyxa salina TaxID=215803 RepID=A0A2S9XRI7_9BACT|nr:glutaredoxin [Enhygromyxa salina]PRP95466.1 Glutaredoxin-3 [Enhygromyxa salina]
MAGRPFPLPDAFDGDVVVYLTPWCPYCVRARRLLDQRGIAYEIFDVSGNSEARQWLARNTGQRTVPQIFIKGRSVGGFDELAELDARGGLPAAT